MAIGPLKQPFASQNRAQQAAFCPSPSTMYGTKVQPASVRVVRKRVRKCANAAPIGHKRAIDDATRQATAQNTDGWLDWQRVYFARLKSMCRVAPASHLANAVLALN